VTPGVGSDGVSRLIGCAKDSNVLYGVDAAEVVAIHEEGGFAVDSGEVGADDAIINVRPIVEGDGNVVVAGSLHPGERTRCTSRDRRSSRSGAGGEA